MDNTEILIRPIITEKSLNRAALSWYTFEVLKSADKKMIKKAVEEIFKVKVLKVKTMVVKGKTRRAGKKMKSTKTSSWKKALVFLSKDQKINLFEVPTSEKKT